MNRNIEEIGNYPTGLSASSSSSLSSDLPNYNDPEKEILRNYHNDNTIDNNVDNTKDNSTKIKSSKKLTSSINDIFWAILFNITLVCFLIWSGFILSYSESMFGNSEIITYIIFSISLFVIASVISCSLIILVLKSNPYLFCWFSYISSICFFSTGLIISCFRKDLNLILSSGIPLSFILISLYCGYKKFKLVTEIYKAADDLSSTFNSAYIIIIIASIIKTVFLIFAAAVLLYSYSVKSEILIQLPIIAIFYIFFYWFTNLIDTICHITLTGSFCSKIFTIDDVDILYYKPLNKPKELSPAMAASRALSSSFGSACYGSFVIPIIQLVRFIFWDLGDIFEARQKQESTIDKGLSFIKNLVIYYSTFTYARIGTFGESFSISGKKTVKQFSKHKGLKTIVGEIVISRLIWLSSIVASIITFALCLIGQGLSSTVFGELSTTFAVNLSCISAFGSIFMVFTALEIVHSSTTTLFLSVALSPESTFERYPDFGRELMIQYPSFNYNNNLNQYDDIEFSNLNTK